MLDREEAASPVDISIIGKETEVVAGVERLSNCGATEVAVRPFGSPEVRAVLAGAVGRVCKNDAREGASSSTASAVGTPSGGVNN
jgi:hypothetical protein